jgi:ABC-type antimicrobial peptide transport system permease subunit
MSYVVADRRHEVGIRLALGATAWDVVRLVLASGMRLVLGCVLGVALAAVVGRVLGSLLFKVSALEPAVYAIATACLLIAALFAIMPPACARQVDPTNALRAE